MRFLLFACLSMLLAVSAVDPLTGTSFEVSGNTNTDSFQVKTPGGTAGDDPTINAVAGSTITFTLTLTNSGFHPFGLSDSADSSTSTSVTKVGLTPVSGCIASDANTLGDGYKRDNADCVLTYVVPAVGATKYYRCATHVGMSGAIVSVAAPASSSSSSTGASSSSSSSAADASSSSSSSPAAAAGSSSSSSSSPAAADGSSSSSSSSPAAAAGSSSSSSSSPAAAAGSSSSSSSSGAAAGSSSSSSSALLSSSSSAVKANNTASVAMPALTVVLATITAAAIVA